LLHCNLMVMFEVYKLDSASQLIGRISMKLKISKANDGLEFFNSRLDEIRMNGHERLKAKARMAQAEAVADAIGAGIDLLKRALKALAPRPHRRPTTSAR